MLRSGIDANVTESAILLKKIIKNFLGENDHGTLRGYLVMDENYGIIGKKDLKQASCISEDGACLSWHGSVKCEEPNEKIRHWVLFLITYLVKENLTSEFGSYPFQRFEISIEFFPEYIYRKNKMIRYKRTKMILPYLKISVKW